MKLLKLPIVDRVLRAAGPRLVWLYLCIVGKTQRVQVEGRNYLAETLEGGGPFLFAFWHNRLLYPAHLYRGTKAGVLVSSSRDGEYIALTMERFGLIPLRGSSARGAATGLLGLARHLKAGYCVAVTPDGPRGPREQVQLGVIALSKMSGVPIVPCSYTPARKIALNSWDRFLIPLPFCRASVVYRDPITIPENAEREEMERLRLQLEEEICLATRRSEELAVKCGI